MRFLIWPSTVSGQTRRCTESAFARVLKRLGESEVVSCRAWHQQGRPLQNQGARLPPQRHQPPAQHLLVPCDVRARPDCRRRGDDTGGRQHGASSDRLAVDHDATLVAAPDLVGALLLDEDLRAQNAATGFPGTSQSPFVQGCAAYRREGPQFTGDTPPLKSILIYDGEDTHQRGTVFSPGGQRSPSVTAPRLALPTSRAYLARTPRV